MGQEKIVANLVTTRAYDLECHKFTPTERERRPTCPKGQEKHQAHFPVV